MWQTFSLKVFSLWNSVRLNRIESIINITQLSRNEHGLRFVLLFGNRWCRLVHKIHSAAVAWIYVHYLPSFASSLSCHVPLYFCFRVVGSPRATEKRNGDIGLSKLNTFYERSSKQNHNIICIFASLMTYYPNSTFVVRRSFSI